MNESHSEHFGEYFRERFLHLRGHRGVTAYDFFTAAVVSGDDPTDGGECRLELRHGTMNERKKLRE